MAQEPKRIRSVKLLLLIGLLTGLLVVGGSYLARGWIRGPLVSWYADRAYLPKIEQTFDQDFKQVNPKLALLGLTFEKHNPGPYAKEAARCFDPMYDGLRLTKYCFKTYYNDSPNPEITDAYRELWRTESPSLEAYILANGWTKTWNAAQPIDELLVRDDRGVSVGVNYVKNHGKITCKLSIRYNGSESNPADRDFNAWQSCDRDVDFFGGYY